MTQWPEDQHYEPDLWIAPDHCADAERKQIERETRDANRHEERSEERWRTITCLAGFVLSFVGGMQFPTATGWLNGVVALAIGAILLVASLYAPFRD